MKATAVAQPNIALIKYWGKAHEDLIVPATGSISVTLDQYPTTTTVTLRPDANTDTATLGGVPLEGGELARVSRWLEHVRVLARSETRAHVDSTNTVPTAAGLASSASGFAALAVAASSAYGLELDARHLSRLARRGSGSASRSIFGGIVRWNAGVNDETSFAEPLAWNGPNLRVIIVEVSTARKHVSSREGMRHTIATSPFYNDWVRSNEELVDRASEAIAHADVRTLGELTELSTLRMHATMLAAEPPLRYLRGESLAVFDAVSTLREDGLVAYATADAGPNVKILTTDEDAQQVESAIRQGYPSFGILGSRLGPGARLLEEPHS